MPETRVSAGPRTRVSKSATGRGLGGCRARAARISEASRRERSPFPYHPTNAIGASDETSRTPLGLVTINVRGATPPPSETPLNTARATGSSSGERGVMRTAEGADIFPMLRTNRDGFGDINTLD